MGLDMYLRGEKYFWTDWRNDDDNAKEDGFQVGSHELRLGYWRKHPNLHGFIVQTFAGGEDECQKIILDADALKAIIEATKTKALPDTTGFFFGASDGTEDDETITICEKAIAWLETPDPGPQRITREVYYTASW